MGERVHIWGHFSLNRLNTFKESKLERASLQGHYQLLTHHDNDPVHGGAPVVRELPSWTVNKGE